MKILIVKCILVLSVILSSVAALKKSPGLDRLKSLVAELGEPGESVKHFAEMLNWRRKWLLNEGPLREPTWDSVGFTILEFLKEKMDDSEYKEMLNDGLWNKYQTFIGNSCEQVLKSIDPTIVSLEKHPFYEDWRLEEHKKDCEDGQFLILWISATRYCRLLKMKNHIYMARAQNNLKLQSTSW